MSTVQKTDSVEYEYWTYDAQGRGYCSHISFEDALRGHFQDMKAKEPLGPIVDAKKIKKTIMRTVESMTFIQETILSEDD